MVFIVSFESSFWGAEYESSSARIDKVFSTLQKAEEYVDSCRSKLASRAGSRDTVVAESWEKGKFCSITYMVAAGRRRDEFYLEEFEVEE